MGTMLVCDRCKRHGAMLETFDWAKPGRFFDAATEQWELCSRCLADLHAAIRATLYVNRDVESEHPCAVCHCDFRFHGASELAMPCIAGSATEHPCRCVGFVA